jgi:hypothetical protein
MKLSFCTFYANKNHFDQLIFVSRQLQMAFGKNNFQNNYITYRKCFYGFGLVFLEPLSYFSDILKKT